MKKLLSPIKIGNTTLPNRIFMAPLTRSRAGQPGDVPSALNATYYAQRAGAGLIVSEATQVSRQGQGYALTPGNRRQRPLIRQFRKNPDMPQLDGAMDNHSSIGPGVFCIFS